ncbi:TPA: hypothetical protein N3A33_000513 [Salmonella enterica subsp. salamae serovar 28:r:e,n,z15]|nr:hypothetical protein [Salmonella enterica subsp. salamae serovar 28:r:e,n,z15]
MKFRVVYDGPALESNEMDVRDLAPALLALSDVFDEAGKVIYGKDVRVSVKVNASFRAGSFGVDLIASSSFTQHLINLLSGNAATAVCNVIALVGFGGMVGGVLKKGLMQFITWVNGRRIKSITPLPDGNVAVTIDEDEQVFEILVIELYKNYRLRQSLERLVYAPLEKEGIDSFAVTLDNGVSFVSISKPESALFKVDKPDDRKISESITEKALQLIDISFNEEHKWRFYDGTGSFHALVSDKKFIKDIDLQAINFAKGDILLVDLKITQHIHPGGIKTAYEVVRVKEIINPARQIDLPLDEYTLPRSE